MKEKDKNKKQKLDELELEKDGTNKQEQNFECGEGVECKLNEEPPKNSDAKQQEIDRLNDQLLRTMAEFQNFRRRNAELLLKCEEEGVAKAVEAILPSLDAFESAVAITQDAKTREGLMRIKSDILAAFSKLGLKEIEAAGKPFDPKFHNAILATEDGEKSGIVLEVFQKGYILGDRVVRHSICRVSK